MCVNYPTTSAIQIRYFPHSARQVSTLCRRAWDCLAVRTRNWQLALAVCLPILVVLTRTYLDMRESPQTLKALVRLSVFVRVFGRSIGGGFAVAALMGLIIGIEAVGISVVWVVLAWGLVAVLGASFLLAVLVIGYLSAGWPGLIVGLIVAGASDHLLGTRHR